MDLDISRTYLDISQAKLNGSKPNSNPKKLRQKGNPQKKLSVHLFRGAPLTRWIGAFFVCSCVCQPVRPPLNKKDRRFWRWITHPSPDLFPLSSTSVFNVPAIRCEKHRESQLLKRRTTYIDNVHFFFVVHVVDCQTTLVDVEVQSSIQLYEQFLCTATVTRCVLTVQNMGKWNW